MPVGVEDGDDRPAALACISQQPVAMGGMAAGIDQDQALGRVEEDTVAVRPAIGLEGARDQVPVRGARPWRSRQKASRQAKAMVNLRMANPPNSQTSPIEG